MKKALFLFLMGIFFSPVFAQVSKSQIDQVLSDVKTTYHLTQEDISNYVITNNYTSRNNGVTHVYIRQMVNHVEIFNANTDLHIDRDGKLIVFHNGFVSNAATLINTTVATLTAVNATSVVANRLELSVAQPLAKTSTNEYTVTDKKASSQPIKTKLYYIFKNKQLLLVWNVSIYEDKTGNWWNKRIDANSGQPVEENSWTAKCDIRHINGISSIKHTTRNTSTQRVAKQGDNGTYNVYAFPLESPAKGGRSIVEDPALPEASPFGWHDVDGIAGADFTTTKGNNVWAVEDTFGMDDIDGYSPEGGTSLVFDFPFDSSVTAKPYIDAAITNLFYWNNVAHDLFYHYGFDEVSGNFQQHNYSALGEENDRVFADAQDGSGTNNANFSTPPDGFNPRMQMFLWSVATNKNLLNITSPIEIKGQYSSAVAGFGPGVPVPGITGEIVRAFDSSPTDPGLCCGTIINNIVGKIALIDRGSCFFADKVFNAEMAGAIGVIIVDTVDEEPFSMGDAGTGLPINIPSIMITRQTGDTLKKYIALGTVNATLVDSSGGATLVDSDFDNGVIIHEYTHGVSNRLTGGAMNTDCLFNAEQGGEGWSDFFALAFTARPSDNPMLGRGMATYLIGQDTNGPGIRQYPYSRNMAINPSTYNDIKTSGEPHWVGFVWCSMLYDIFWDMVDQYGFEDPYTGHGGNNIAMQLVMDGMKLQPCSPGFVDARDAIIMADELNNGGANHDLLWKAFARRGLGYSANQGSSQFTDDGAEAFDTPPPVGLADIILAEELTIFPNPFQHGFNIALQTNDNITGTISVMDITGKVLVTKPAVILGKKAVAIELPSLAPGVYIVSIQTERGTITKKMIRE